MGLLDTLNRVCSLVREVLLGFRSEAKTDAANGHLLTKWARDKYGVEKKAAVERRGDSPLLNSMGKTGSCGIAGEAGEAAGPPRVVGPEVSEPR